MPHRIFCLLFVLGSLSQAACAEAPAWAYPVNPPGDAAAPDNGRLIHVPGSAAGFTRTQLSAIGGHVSDWHPEEHPAMPPIVSEGHPPKVYACAYCHLPNGAGRPENASLAGLSPAYLLEQVRAFRSGNRPGSEPRRGPQSTMVAIAQATTDGEAAEAAAYFASIKPACFVRVVETDTVPKTVVRGWTLKRAPEGGSEPLGNRIIEMPEDFQRFEDRDSRTGYVAYVPVGSLRQGAELAATGAWGRSLACATCHGADLRGVADVPRLAGRSPGYLARQLFDLRAGNRRGGNAELMKPVVARLTDADVVALAAYLASCAP